jgi:hypothetical protein
MNTLKNVKINDSFESIYSFFGKIPCIEKIFVLENYLDWKIPWIEKLLALKKN